MKKDSRDRSDLSSDKLGSPFCIMYLGYQLAWLCLEHEPSAPAFDDGRAPAHLQDRPEGVGEGEAAGGGDAAEEGQEEAHHAAGELAEDDEGAAKEEGARGGNTEGRPRGQGGH